MGVGGGGGREREKNGRSDEKNEGKKNSKKEMEKTILSSFLSYLERRDAGVDRLWRRVLDSGLGVAGGGAGRLAGLGRGLELGAEGLLGGLFFFFFRFGFGFLARVLGRGFFSRVEVEEKKKEGKKKYFDGAIALFDRWKREKKKTKTAAPFPSRHRTPLALALSLVTSSLHHSPVPS